MKKQILDFLCSLEGYHQVLKEIHWSTKVKAEHLLTDEIDGKVLKYEDRLAEVTMGATGTRFGIGDLKSLLPNAKSLDGLIKEMQKDVIELKNKIEKFSKSDGIVNVLDDFSETIDSWMYLETFK